MYGTIVVPLDCSPFAERALHPAVELADVEKSRLVLFSATVMDETRAYLHDVGADLPVPSTVITNDDQEPAAAIASITNPDTLVCMASHGRTGARRAVLGSVTEEVLRSSDVPVLVVGPNFEPERPIVGGLLLVCLDGSSRAEQILPVATEWAKAFRMEIWLVNVSSPEAAEGRREVDGDVLDSGYLASVAHALGQALPDEVPSVQWVDLHGRQAAPRLVEAAAELPAAVVAMTTQGSTGLRRAVLGSVTTEVVHEAPCPVLIVRSR